MNGTLVAENIRKRIGKYINVQTGRPQKEGMGALIDAAVGSALLEVAAAIQDAQNAEDHGDD